MKSKLSILQICMISIAIVMNLIGGQIALLFKLPIYLDSIGTVLIASVYGPVLGALPSLLSSIILGITIDPFSLYYAPVGVLIGILSGITLRKKEFSFLHLIISAFIITLPSTLTSSLITVYLFGGITSSGSSYFIQILAKTPLGLIASCFIVQFFTDFIDRLTSIYFVKIIFKKAPKLNQLK